LGQQSLVIAATKFQEAGIEYVDIAHRAMRQRLPQFDDPVPHVLLGDLARTDALGDSDELCRHQFIEMDGVAVQGGSTFFEGGIFVEQEGSAELLQLQAGAVDEGFAAVGSGALGEPAPDEDDLVGITVSSG
jgi:hypothetical protein